MSSTNNVQTITLGELDLLASDVDDVCSGIVHSILFQRVIGLYRALEGRMQSLDVSFVSRAHITTQSNVPRARSLSLTHSLSLNSTTTRFAFPSPNK
jgi:predicted thioredoxin/glutaredoxin